jgi:hypothetical protein
MMEQEQNNGETCPEGWKVSSVTEWWNVSTSWSNAQDAFNSALKLPMPGQRNHDDGTFSNEGTWGNYWSSSANGTDATNFNFLNFGVYFSGGYARAYGLSVRCLKE